MTENLCVAIKTFISLSTGGVVVLNGAIIPNHGFVLLDNIGESHESLLCLTDLPACCHGRYTGGRGPLGDWFFPNGTRLLNRAYQWEFYRSRGRMVVFMHRRRDRVTGIYRCEIPDLNDNLRRLYVGVYTAITGGYFRITLKTYTRPL